MKNPKRLMTIITCLCLCAGCTSNTSHQDSEETTQDSTPETTAVQEEKEPKQTNPYESTSAPTQWKVTFKARTLEDGQTELTPVYSLTLKQLGAWAYANLNNYIEGSPEFTRDGAGSEGSGADIYVLSISPNVDLVAQLQNDEITAISLSDYSDSVSESSLEIVNKMVNATNPGEEKDWGKIMMEDGIPCDGGDYTATDHSILFFIHMEPEQSSPYYCFHLMPQDLSDDGRKDSFLNQVRGCN